MRSRIRSIKNLKLDCSPSKDKKVDEIKDDIKQKEVKEKVHVLARFTHN